MTVDRPHPSAVGPRPGAISPLINAGDALIFWVSCYHTPAINTRPE
jgi:hypothetical protein